MPRQDVPYGGAICRLKERIAEIWDKLDQKLHSINGVEGDGAGNVDIVSGNAAVVINNDQIGHRIEVALDSSKLPAAAVSSVNGQTGAVRLDAADIPSNGNFNVQADIDWCKQRINECFDSITTEQDDRKAADDTLQTNINAVSANIPEMSITPDPYKGVERDAQGMAYAADPAAGATDKTLVTANWVSQTGDEAPNNLIHKTGNETKRGRFNLPDGMCGIFYKYAINTNNTTENAWRKAFSIAMPDNDILIFDIFSGFNNADTQNARIKLYKRENSVLGCCVITSDGSTQIMASASNYVATLDKGVVTFYTKKIRRYSNLFMVTVYYGEYGYNKTLPEITYLNTDSVDPSTETHDAIATGIRIAYHNEE